MNLGTIDAEVTADLQAFLFEEAQLLDDHLFDAWLGILDPNIRYVMPSTGVLPPPATPQDRAARDAARWGVRTDEAEAPLRFWVFDEDYNSLNMRVRRLDTGMAHAELPESITNHLVSNVTATPDPDDEDLYRVRSTFLVHQVRHERNESTFVGSRWDQIRRTPQGFRLLRRHIELGHPVLPRTVSIFF